MGKFKTQKGIFHSKHLVLCLGRRRAPRKSDVPDEDMSKKYPLNKLWN